jgi:hypothetical protein
MLRSTKLPLPGAAPAEKTGMVRPLHDAKYWAAKTKSFDFTQEDRLDSAAYNRILWEGMKTDRPYPVHGGRNRESAEADER